MKYFWIVLGICIALFFVWKMLEPPSPVSTPSFLNNITISPEAFVSSQKIFDLVNNYRIGQGLSELSWNNSMCAYTYIRLFQIHTDPTHDVYIKNPHPYGTTQDYTGENLEEGPSTDEQVIFDSWINSSEHLRNIVNPHFTQTCIASDNFNNNTYTVEEFDSLVNCYVNQSYWYCWDTGNPSPHHLGYKSTVDHLCTTCELGQ